MGASLLALAKSIYYLQTQERMSLNSLKQQRRSGRPSIVETTRETTIAKHHNTEPLAFRELKEEPLNNHRNPLWVSDNQHINNSGKEKYTRRGVAAK